MHVTHFVQPTHMFEDRLGALTQTKVVCSCHDYDEVEGGLRLQQHTEARTACAALVGNLYVHLLRHFSGRATADTPDSDLTKNARLRQTFREHSAVRLKILSTIAISNGEAVTVTQDAARAGRRRFLRVPLPASRGLHAQQEWHRR